MDYLDKMIEAYNTEMGLWRIALCEGGLYEIWRGPALIDGGNENDGKPHLMYESFNKHRMRSAMEAAFEAAYFEKWPPKTHGCIDPDQAA